MQCQQVSHDRVGRSIAIEAVVAVPRPQVQVCRGFWVALDVCAKPRAIAMAAISSAAIPAAWHVLKTRSFKPSSPSFAYFAAHCLLLTAVSAAPVLGGAERCRGSQLYDLRVAAKRSRRMKQFSGAGRAAVTALDGGSLIAQLVMISCSGWVDPSEPAEEVSEQRS